MVKPQTDVFWKAIVLTIVVFSIGLQAGIWLDNLKVEEVKSTLTELELQFNDARLQSVYYNNFYQNTTDFCMSSFNANIDFNNRIYKEGVQIERYESANRFSPELVLEKRKYALLQMQFWMNAEKIRTSCNSDYYTALYFYKYDTSNNSAVEMPQKLQSAVLLDLKEKCGNKLMLSPMPIDLNMTTVDMIVSNNHINTTPAILINGNTILEGLKNMSELESVIRCQ